MALTRAEIWRVASAERSASRCTSSATTEKPPPASPAPAPRIPAIKAHQVALLGDVGDQFGDFTDLLRGFAQALDALGGVLNLIADRVHAADGVLHRLQARVRRLQRLARHRG